MSRSQPSVLRQRARMVALLVVLLAFDVAFVAAVYVLAHVAIALAPLLAYNFAGVGLGLSFDLIPLWMALAVGTPLTLLVQSVFGYRLTLQDVRRGEVGPDKSLKNILLADRGDSEEPPEPTAVAAPALRQRVARLAQTAGVEAPELQVVDSETPNSYVASRPGERTLFVTTGLLEALDDDELDAVLAHELAHLSNGDAFVMTAAAFLPTVSEYVLDSLVASLRRSALVNWVLDLDIDDDRGTFGAPQIEVPLLVFAVVAAPIAGVLYLASTACYRLLSRIREYAADAAGVAITGAPAAMASALETLTVDYRPETDLRTAETGVRELCVLPYAMGEGERIPDDIFGRAQERWDRVCDRLLPGSHPDPVARIAALRERQADFERR